MGADLYAVGFEKHCEGLTEAFDLACKARNEALDGTTEATEAQAKVDELYELMHSPELYFRDSYNDTSLLWRMGLSWWSDVGKMLIKGDDKGNITPTEDNPHAVNMPPKVCLELATLIESKEVQLLTRDEWVEKGFDETPESWNTYYTDKKQALVRFLKTAANSGGVDASI